MTTRELPLDEVTSTDLVSLCCKAKIYASLADGVVAGTCSACHEYVTRLNPKTGEPEWLDGETPWTKKELRPAK